MKVSNAIKFGAISAILSVAGNANEHFSAWGAVLGPTFQASVNNDQANINRRAIGGRFFSDYFEYPLAFQRGVESFNALVERFNNTYGSYILKDDQPVFSIISLSACIGEERDGLLASMHRYLDPTIDTSTRDDLYSSISIAVDNPTEPEDLGTLQRLIKDHGDTLGAYSALVIGTEEGECKVSDNEEVPLTLSRDFAYVVTAAGVLHDIAAESINALDQLSTVLKNQTDLTDRSLVDLLSRNDKTLENLVRIILAKVSDLHVFLH
ncbi:MAG: hypothetical protein LBJ89_01620 [Holosporales bacterium]|jgi:hypothetical protein|nr:hypothetical protein [Holosporales bacterium]